MEGEKARGKGSRKGVLEVSVSLALGWFSSFKSPCARGCWEQWQGNLQIMPCGFLP